MLLLTVAAVGWLALAAPAARLTRRLVRAGGRSVEVEVEPALEVVVGSAVAAGAGVLAPPDCRALMASTRSLLRIFVVPVMPIDTATPLSSSSFMADRPETARVVDSDTKDPSPSFAARDTPWGRTGASDSGRVRTTSAS